MIIKQEFLPTSTPPRPCIVAIPKTSITIHWTGPYPGQTPEMIAKYWADKELSAHFIIKDKQCLNVIPDAEVAWHCGVKEGNYFSIGIECIPMSKSGQFSFDTIETLHELVQRYELPLKRHFDWSGKRCPEWYVDEQRWEELKEMLA